MSGIAHCCCGSLRAGATGEPALVAACHCMECQRRTSSAFGQRVFQKKISGTRSNRASELATSPNMRLETILVARLQIALWRIDRI